VASPHTGDVARLACLVLLVLALSAGAADARRDDHGGRGQGGGDLRVAGTCGRGAASSLRLGSRDDGIEIRFQLRQTRGRGVWRITLVHERRVSWRAKRRTTRSDDSLELHRTVPDLPGSDTVVVEAWGPRGLGCRVTATLPAVGAE